MTPSATGTATAAQQITTDEGSIMAEKTKVRTTLGFEVEADASELVDLQRQGLIETKKDQRAADAAIKDAEAAAAEANEGRAV